MRPYHKDVLMKNSSSLLHLINTNDNNEKLKDYCGKEDAEEVKKALRGCAKDYQEANDYEPSKGTICGSRAHYNE